MPPDDLPSHFIDLVQDALLKSFWRKNALLNFLRRHKISENFLATWQETETKRVFVARLLPKVEGHSRGSQIIKQMAVSLAEQVKFPDLEGWEDTPQKVQAANEAVQALRQYLDLHKQKAEEIKAREETKKVARQRLQETIAKRQTLESLSSQLTELSRRLGTQAAGYEFQNWFYDLVGFFEMTNRRPYVVSGRQVDGSVTVEGTTYLTELKFTREQAGAPDVDTFLAKVNDKADNTMGIMVSMSGYSITAIQQASGRKTPLILMDFSHVYLVLGGTWTLPEVVSRLRRHVSQTGQAFLPASEFGS
ncbi:MAG: hypothetical protein L0Y58_03735 [Verrucomicrobia subdivision 3 bacterium]|nr:hypothetical protein [Limisphaerales bacterium]